jgi:hypothetical protein
MGADLLTGRLILIANNILKIDFTLFFSFYLVLLFAFGSAFALVSPRDINQSSFTHWYTTVWHSVVYTLDASQGGIGLWTSFDSEDLNTFSQILIVCFRVFIILVLLNLLIAMMNDSFSKNYGSSTDVIHQEKYNMMCSFDRDLSTEQLSKERKEYTIDIGREIFFEFKEFEDEKWWSVKKGKRTHDANVKSTWEKLLKLYKKII